MRTQWIVAAALCGGCGVGLHQPSDTIGGVSDAGDDGVDDGTYDDEEEYVLRLNEETPEPLTLEMSEQEVMELFGPVADQVLLMELDTTALFTNTMTTIKSACGSKWKQDNPDPQHDCSLTPLGQTFKGPNGSWQTSPEYSLVRLLTMTPANAKVAGTSIAGLAEMSDVLGIGGGYPQILADALGIPRTQEIVSTAALVKAFQDNYLGSHPNVEDGQFMGVTLYDALNNLTPLMHRYGPEGEHPGVLSPDFPVYGEVFGPDFSMKAVAESNLRVVDGISLGGGKDFMTVVADDVGPTYEDEVEFDFNDPNKFQLSGLVEDLTIDLRFKVSEDDSFVPSCTGDPNCVNNLPGNPVWSASVWATDPWLFEHNVAAAAKNEYNDRTYYVSYLLGAAKIFIGMGGNPGGWMQYDILLDLGDPPEDQYLWETILEIAQVVLHNTEFQTFAEGAADVEFTLHDVPVGLTGSEAAEVVRPFLQDQASKLSDFLLGDYKKNNGDVDFYYRRASDGQAYVFFVIPDDLREDQDYTYEFPGFYDSPDLSPDSKVSETAVPGLADTGHEKLELAEGLTTVYAADKNGAVYRLRFDVSGGSDQEITVGVAHRLND